jgi:phosphoglycerate dehydrogenase-like enzyme
MALVLALARDVVRLCARTRAGGWERPLGRDLYGGTLGIVGLGRIGKETALKARAFGLRVVAADPVEDPGFARAAEITYLLLDELLAVADFVVLHCPLTPATRGLIGRRELAHMKPTAYLINVARGAVVDEEALYRALKAGRPAGAGLDVYSEEPPRDSPLLTLDNVIALPHIAAYTGATVRAMDLVAVQACLDVLAGKRPANLVCGASGDGGGPSRPR